MSITTRFAALSAAAILATTSTEAALITYHFIPSAAPAPGGGVFSAQASFDDTLIGGGLQTTAPTKFSASLTGNSLYADRTWELEEIGLSFFEISPWAALTYAVLLGTDTDPVQFGFGSTLMAGVGAFVSPVYVPGLWVQDVVETTPDVPESGPGVLAAAVVAGMAVVARRQRRIA